MNPVYRFGGFELRPHRQQLLQDGEPVVLGHRAFDVLLALVERAGRLVTKDELLKLVWPGLVVEENNLQVQVSTLRKILGTSAIATAAGRGYRFTLEIASASEARSPAPAVRHNLPQPLTSFVGHAEDLDEYAALVAQARLFTLTGIGGCGKSRLALELARRVLSSFPDGVWHVDLAPLLDAGRVALTIATTMGVRQEGDRPLLDVLCEQLASQRGLLVLDNCEHLSAACADVARRLLAASPRLHILAASREGLGIAGERAATVRSLAFPQAGAPQDLAALAACEAVRLFVDRAALAVPKFALTETTAPVVGEICRRLDGIPLAIELAAARIKLLSVAEIRARLDDRFRLLTGSGRMALARQQTLLAIIQWSYDHLAAAEQHLLRQLAVFAGGWTLEGATRVASETQDEYAVLDLLARLVDQSLVTTQVHDGRTRYAMLETVRQYALERLVEAGEDEAARMRHLEFYLALAEESEPEVVGREQASWLTRLELERENFLVAHAWCDYARDGAQLGLRLVYALCLFLRQRGFAALGYRITTEALAREGAQAPELARCKALWAACEHSYFMGRYQEAKRYMEEGHAIALAVNDDSRLAESLRLLGYVALALGDPIAAREHFTQAVAKARQVGDQLQISGTVNGLAELHRSQGELGLALPLYEEALVLCQEREDRGTTAVHIANLVMTIVALGGGARARVLARDGLRIVVDIGARRIGMAQLDGVTMLAASEGDWAFAARLHGATEALIQQLGTRREPTDEASVAPFIVKTRQMLGDGAFADALATGRTLTYDEAVAQAQSWVDRGA